MTKKIIAKYGGFELNGQPAYIVDGNDAIFTEDLLTQVYGENFVFETYLKRQKREELDEFLGIMVGGFKK